MRWRSMTEHRNQSGLERQAELMMRALDDELNAEERAELDAHLAEQPELRAEWQRLSRAREVTMGMKLRNPPEDVWDGYWTSTYSRIERGVAWILVSVGAIIVGVWAIREWITALLNDTATPAPVRYSMIALFVGLLILLISVARHRLNVSKSDPYKDIQR
jgi:ferric-dicitrate binding protein FerR (iron transport regulator)